MKRACSWVWIVFASLVVLTKVTCMWLGMQGPPLGSGNVIVRVLREKGEFLGFKGENVVVWDQHS